MGVLGLYLIRRGVPRKVQMIEWEICTALLDAAMLVLLLFHDIPSLLLSVC